MSKIQFLNRQNREENLVIALAVLFLAILFVGSMKFVNSSSDIHQASKSKTDHAPLSGHTITDR